MESLSRHRRSFRQREELHREKRRQFTISKSQITFSLQWTQPSESRGERRLPLFACCFQCESGAAERRSLAAAIPGVGSSTCSNKPGTHPSLNERKAGHIDAVGFRASQGISAGRCKQFREDIHKRLPTKGCIFQVDSTLTE